jgi:hypothetical protein
MRRRPSPLPWLLFVAGGLLGPGCGAEDPEPAPRAAVAARTGAEDGEPRLGMHLYARREVAVAGRPIGLLAREVTGDAYADALVVTRSPGTLVCLPGGLGGLSATAFAQALGDDYPLPPSDLGARGFAIALQSTRELCFFARADAPPERTALGAVPRALGAGDLDGDGRMEALAALTDGTLATGFGAELARYALPPELHGRVTFVEVLEPGLVVLGLQAPPSLFALRLAADEPARIEARVELGGIPRAALQADVDGDRDAELVVAGGQSSLYVLGQGTGGGPAAWVRAGADVREVESPGAIPVDLAQKDLDGNGRAELLLLNFYDCGYAVLGGLDGQARPAFSAREYAGQDPVAFAPADFDGDGHCDLAIANRSAGRVSLLVGTGFAEAGRSPFEQAQRVPTGPNPTRVRSGNLDGDALPEAVVLCAGDQTVLARANRMGLLEPGGAPLRRDSQARALAAGAPEGRAEVALLEADDDRAHCVRLTPGSTAVASVEAGREARDLFYAKDGEREVLVSVDPRGLAVWIFEPSDAPPRRLATASPPLAAAAIELDGDARAELAVAGAAELQLFDDLERPLSALPLVLPGHTPEAMTAADVDGDGREDLVLLYGGAEDTAPGRIAVLLGEPGGAFRRAFLVETGLAPAALAVGDLDGDGRAEILCAAQNSHHLNLWSPRPEGTLERLADLGAGLGPLDVHLVDLDGDERLDILAANNFSHDLSVIYNLAP